MSYCIIFILFYSLVYSNESFYFQCGRAYLHFTYNHIYICYKTISARSRKGVHVFRKIISNLLFHLFTRSLCFKSDFHSLQRKQSERKCLKNTPTMTIMVFPPCSQACSYNFQCVNLFT